MKLRRKTLVFVNGLALSLFLFAHPSRAATDFDYPELQVTPHASERLEMEANQEKESRWITHIPVQVSALSTLIAGITQLNEGDKPPSDPTQSVTHSGIAGVAVGGGWLVATALLASYYEPYESAEKQIKPLPHGTPREQLIRERLAEEDLNSAARLGTTIKWLSFLSNAGVNAFMLANAQSGGTAKVVDGVAAAASLAPFFFSYRWNRVAASNEEYKKKIYAPIAALGWKQDSSSGQLAPVALMSMNF